MANIHQRDDIALEIGVDAVKGKRGDEGIKRSS